MFVNELERFPAGQTTDREGMTSIDDCRDCQDSDNCIGMYLNAWEIS